MKDLSDVEESEDENEEKEEEDEANVEGEDSDEIKEEEESSNENEENNVSQDAEDSDDEEVEIKEEQVSDDSENEAPKRRGPVPLKCICFSFRWLTILARKEVKKNPKKTKKRKNKFDDGIAETPSGPVPTKKSKVDQVISFIKDEAEDEPKSKVQSNIVLSS